MYHPVAGSLDRFTLCGIDGKDTSYLFHRPAMDLCYAHEQIKQYSIYFDTVALEF